MNNTALSADQPRGRAWLATGALGISAFAIVTSELAPVGMLQALAQTFQQTAAQTGQVVTVYGWVAALAALLSVALPARISRKTLLVTLMLLLALASLAAAQAPGFPLFMAARLAGAIAHGVFWALIGSVAVQLVPAEKLGRATAVIFGGVSAASVLGVPLASYLAAVTGWREAFTVISLLALVTACALLRTLPALAPSAAQPLRPSAEKPASADGVRCDSLHHLRAFCRLYLCRAATAGRAARTGSDDCRTAAGFRVGGSGRKRYRWPAD